MGELNILHTFKAYLPNSENWAYRLISETPGTKSFLTTDEFLQNNFYKKEFSYFQYPLGEIPNPTRQKRLALANRLIRMAKSIYPAQQFLAEKCKSHHIDLIHSHFAFVGWKYLGISQELALPHLISFYGYDYEFLPHSQPEWKEKYQQLFKKADAFICEGSYGASVLEKMGCEPSKIHVVKLGVSTREIQFFKRKKEEKKLKLLQVAAFREKKGHIFTLKAFKKALQKCTDMSLTLVGYGPLGASLRQYVTANGLQEHVHFIDQIDFSNLHAFMKDYDVFIHPSCYSQTMDCEGGAPVVLLDAQATGMPVISTRHCDIPDEVLHEQTGKLAKEKDADTLARYIEEFYTMGQEEFDTFASNARKHMEVNYDITLNAVRLSDVYRNIRQAYEKSLMV